MYVTSFLTIAFVYTLAVISPGPDFAIVLQNSMTYHRRIAVYTPLGISVGIFIHTSYCILGLAIIITQSVWLFNLIKFFGALYLIYVGVNAMLSSADSHKIVKKEEKNDIKKYKAFIQGLFCNVFNPKATLFILGIFAFVVKPDTPFYIQWLYAFEVFIITFLWFSCVVIIVSHPSIKNKIFSIQSLFTKTLGVVLILLGIKLAMLIHL
jgi:RhtB (resistance to homoserine/threonine) family protein